MTPEIAMREILSSPARREISVKDAAAPDVAEAIEKGPQHDSKWPTPGVTLTSER
jgi:hypothetical protein